MIRHIGYACQNTTLNQIGKISTSRTLRMDRFSLQRVGELAVKNSEDLLTLLKWNTSNNINFFRVGSGVFPFMDHYTLGYQIDELELSHAESIRNNLQLAGAYAREHKMRLSCHPGPFCCLGSPNNDTVNKTVRCLEMHSEFADLLGFGDEFAINIHVGGVYEDKSSTCKRFALGYKMLSPKLQRRLTIENDDKSSMWNMSDLHEMISPRCDGLKLVLDIHHHRFCQRESLKEAAQMAFETWKGFCEIPKVHYSESKPNSRPQAHSDYITQVIPDLGATVYDVMIEAKAKEMALIRYRSL